MPHRKPSATVPPVDAQLARRIEAADVSYSVARLEWLAALPENPMQAAVHRIGGAVVLRAPGVRGSMFSRVLLADDSVLPHLDATIAAGGGHLARGRFDILPPLPSSRLMRELSRRGFACTAHFSALYGAAAATTPVRPFGGSVRRVRPDDLDDWIAIYNRAFGFAGADAERMGGSLRALPDRDEAVLLVAELDGRIVATTALWIDGRTGYIALCATLPEAWGRGCQTALIYTCAVLSAERGCDLVAAHAAVGSQSQRNFEHAGLRLAFHKGIWTRPPA